jgi:competence protein ComEC
MYQARYLRYIPFVRLVVPLGLGIWCADYFGVTAMGFTLLFCIFFFLLVLIVVLRFHPKYRLRWGIGVVAFLFLFSMGMVLAINAFPSLLSGPVKVNAEAVVKKNEFTTGGYQKVTVCPVSIFAEVPLPFKAGDLWQIITRPPDSLGPKFMLPGDTLSFITVIKGPEGPTNPDAFNYGRYLFRNGIAGSSFVDWSAIKLKGRGEIIGINGVLESIRHKVQDIYSSCGIEGDQLNVLLALTLGIREELGPELKDRFVRSGAVHILAVSGLHVGIIFLILNSLFSFLFPSRSWIKLLLIVGGLWFFALLTGGAPSVFRAVVMFSIIQIGRFVSRQTNIFNLLGASAFIILSISPLALFQVGFWLSHLAVAGIVSLYPLLSRWAIGLPVFFRWLWNLMAMSLAAQIATFPLSVALFKAFPVYFLLANILVLPLVAPIIILSVLLIVSSSVDFLSQFWAAPLNDILEFMNEVVQWLDTLPGAYQENLWISWPMMLFFYLFLGSVLLYFEFKNRYLIKLAFVSMAGVLLMLNVQYLIKAKTYSFVVFDAGKDNIIGSVFSGQGFLWCSNEVTQKKRSFIADGFFTKNACSFQTGGASISSFQPSVDSLLFLFPVKNGCFLGLRELNLDKIGVKKQVPVQGVVLLDKVEGDIASLMLRLECNNLIISSACPRWWVLKWKNVVEKRGIRVYDVAKEGAFLQQF